MFLLIVFLFKIFLTWSLGCNFSAKYLPTVWAAAVSCDKYKSWLLTRTDLLSHDSYKQAGNIRMSCVAMEFCLPWISVQQLHEKLDSDQSSTHAVTNYYFWFLCYFLIFWGGREVVRCEEWYFVIRWCNCDVSQPAREFFYNLPPPPTSIYQSSIVD